MSCPHCGDSGFTARPYPEESHCDHCGASFFGSGKAVFDPLVSVSIKIRSSHREKVRGSNLSEKVRDWIDRETP
jgi:hypothetical protein